MNGDRALPEGLYDLLVTPAVESLLARLGSDRAGVHAVASSEDLAAAIAQHFERLIRSGLSPHADAGMDRLIAVLERLATAVGSALEIGVEDVALIAPPKALREIFARTAPGALYPETPRPDTPLGRSTLLTGTRFDPPLGLQLEKEMASADRVDILCSFIKWSGVRPLRDAFESLAARAAARGDETAIRVITTSYMGATDPKAVAWLTRLPRAEVRASYDVARTRLHAKAYLIHRQTGFGSAYIGSANLSRAAMSEGLEWTTKISERELPHLWRRTGATFEAYWNDPEFEPVTAATIEKLGREIDRQRRKDQAGAESPVFFDLRPYPFQEEILDRLRSERLWAHGAPTRHLVVAATGTGKTMIAAFDYLAWRGSRSSAARLLFVAHREEILDQALSTFRSVLRDRNFGDKIAGGLAVRQLDHVFATIQSYESERTGLAGLAPEHFDYVVVDEFHHAAAPSYRRLLERVKPRVLLGLTATPERSDGLDVLRYFDHRVSAEIRLPDAIERRLLSPFQYLGVADCVDLDQIPFRRGAYDQGELDRLYRDNAERADLVLRKVAEYVADLDTIRGLGFCVSVAHAHFMAEFFNGRGCPSLALSGASSEEERSGAQARLRRREIRFIFVVDLYNEGIDIPEVDTVLLLRPTESLTVYLQQIGRGLRLHQEKDFLTILDFIGAHRREFRFAARLEAFLTTRTRSVEAEFEHGLPHVPAGCSMHFERVAAQRVLANIRQATRRALDAIKEEARLVFDGVRREPTIEEVIEPLGIEAVELMKRGPWSRVLAEIGIRPYTSPDRDPKAYSGGLVRLGHWDDPGRLEFALSRLENRSDVGALSPLDRVRLSMLCVPFFGSAQSRIRLADAEKTLFDDGDLVFDLKSLLEYLRARALRETKDAVLGAEALALHAHYSLEEILLALGLSTFERPLHFREGVKHVPDRRIDVFFVTLQKSADEYSPTTMYDDYAISDRLFHWQSQSTTAAESATGRRYVEHRERGYTPLLFVRNRAEASAGRTSPYAFLGPLDHVTHQGSRPMSITWRLRTPMPARFVRSFVRQTVG